MSLQTFSVADAAALADQDVGQVALGVAEEDSVQPTKF